MAAVAILVSQKKGDTGYAALKRESETLRHLFAHEIIFPVTKEDGLPFDRGVFDYLRAESITGEEGRRDHRRRGGARNPQVSREVIQEYFESYLIVLYTVLNQRVRKIGRKDLIADIRKSGVRLYHTGEVRLSESLSMPNYENAVRRIVEDEILVQKGSGQKNPEVSSWSTRTAPSRAVQHGEACLEVIA